MATPIQRGGTGKRTRRTGFNALSPSSAKGDLIIHDGTDNIAVNIGADGTYLKADSGAASGASWAAAPTPTIVVQENLVTVGAYTTINFEGSVSVVEEPLDSSVVTVTATGGGGGLTSAKVGARAVGSL